MKIWLHCGLVTIVLLIGFAIFLAYSAYLRHQKIAYWTKGSTWYDHTLSEEENGRSRVAALRGLGPSAVSELIKDLRCKDSLYEKFYELLTPSLQAGLPIPVDASCARREAAYLLGQLGPDANPAVTDLVRLLHDENRNVRYFAAEALGSIGNHSETVVLALKTLYSDPDAEVRFAAALAVWRMNHTEAQAASLAGSLLVNKYNSGELAINWGGNTLATLGREANRFAPALMQGMTNSPNRTTKIVAAKALWRVDGLIAPALTVLYVITNALANTPFPFSSTMSNLSDPKLDLCYSALELIEIPEFRTAVKPHLSKLANDPDPETARMASNSLWRIEHWHSQKGGER